MFLGEKKKSESQFLVCFGTQRCGSNFFLSTLKRFDNIDVYGEMFHKHNIFPMCEDSDKDQLFRRVAFEYLSFYFPNLLEKVKEQLLLSWPATNEEINRLMVTFFQMFPGNGIRLLEKMSSKSVFACKIFPEHLELDSIEKLLGSDFQIRSLVMVRNALDTFLSFKKLQKTSVPQNMDTSTLKVRFDIDEYQDYKSHLDHYYSRVVAALKNFNIPHKIVSYEDFHNDERDAGDKILEIMNELSLPVGGFDATKFSSLKYSKQDNSSLERKVSNPQDLPTYDSGIIRT